MTNLSNVSPKSIAYAASIIRWHHALDKDTSQDLWEIAKFLEGHLKAKVKRGELSKLGSRIEALPAGALAPYTEPLGLVMEHFAAVRQALASRQEALAVTIQGLNQGRRASRAYAHAPEV